MKSFINTLLLISLFAFVVSSCEEDEANELKLEFKVGASYTSEDITLPAGTVVTIGIEAETEKSKDPIISFNISESVNGGSNATVYTESLNDTDYEHDYTFTLGGNSGETHKFTFTITNRRYQQAEDLIVTVQ
jgi:hypothetical protein